MARTPRKISGLHMVGDAESADRYRFRWDVIVREEAWFLVGLVGEDGGGIRRGTRRFEAEEDGKVG